MPAKTRLYLVRHGATPSNEMVPYILQGNGINQSLSETGQCQAKAVGDFMSHLRIDAVYCSPLKRAVETATEIARHHDLQPQPTEGIHEVNVGRWEGMDWGSIQKQDPEAHAQFMANPGTTPYLDGESYADVLARSEPVIREIVERHAGQHVVVVAHNVVNRAFLAELVGRSIETAKQIEQSNTGINVIDFENKTFRLVTMNSNFHLETPFPAAS